MFRGSASTKIDEKGRLKVPTQFRRELEERHGPDVFITSILGDSALVYPLREWEQLEERLAALPSTDRTRRRFLERVAYYGQLGRLDSQGRVIVPALLRESAAMSGEVVVSGRLDHLEVWNHERLRERFDAEPFSEDDFQYLSEKGV